MPHAIEAPHPLRLVAMDAEDLAVLSANLQDALIPLADMTYLPRQKRFALAGKRFDWVKAAAGTCERCAIGAHFDYVERVSRTGFDATANGQTLNLLAIDFETRDAPAGVVTLLFSGGAAIRLDVECIDAQMRDLGERWPCDCEPTHP